MYRDNYTTVDGEQWKPMVGHESICEVSNIGRVKRVFYKGKVSSYILTPRLKKNGYLEVGIRSGSGRNFFLIHRIVLMAFVPNYQGKPQVNHINSNKSDNRVENLEWSTCSENINHSWRAGTRKINSGCFKKGHNRWLKVKEQDQQ